MAILKKRKHANDDEAQDMFSTAVEMEMPSEDEAEVQASDDDPADDFPELDLQSDSEDDSESENDSKEESEDDSEESNEDDADTFDDDLHIFPKAKNVISDITGQPKRVYPDIEPEYDSDSSTEDVGISMVHSD